MLYLSLDLPSSKRAVTISRSFVSSNVRLSKAPGKITVQGLAYEGVAMGVGDGSTRGASGGVCGFRDSVLTGLQWSIMSVGGGGNEGQSWMG